MAGSARPTINFSALNSLDGCSTENGKPKTENFSEQFCQDVNGGRGNLER
jgi:hypothetical protein